MPRFYTGTTSGGWSLQLYTVAPHGRITTGVLDDRWYLYGRSRFFRFPAEKPVQFGLHSSAKVLYNTSRYNIMCIIGAGRTYHIINTLCWAWYCFVVGGANSASWAATDSFTLSNQSFSKWAIARPSLGAGGLQGAIEDPVAQR